MTIKELTAKLSEFSPETQVLIYIGEVEEYGDVQIIKEYKPEERENMPYSKGKKPQRNHNIVLIEGELTC